MATYRYVARTVAGETVKGLLEADSPASASQILRERGYITLAVVPISATDGGGNRERHGEAGAPESDIPWVSRLSDYTAEEIGKALQPKVEEEDGWPLIVTKSNLLRRVRQSAKDLPPWVIGTVAAAEECGKLDALMPVIGWALAEEENKARRARPTLTYFKTTIALVPIVVSIALHVGSGFGNVSFVNALQLYGPALVLSRIIAWGMNAAFRTRRVREISDACMAVTPAVGPMRRARGLRRFAHVFRALYEAGLAVPEAFVRGIPAAGDPGLVRSLKQAGSHVARGSSLKAAFTSAKAFPTEVTNHVGLLEEIHGLNQFPGWLVTEYDGRATDATSRARVFVSGALVALGLGVLFFGAAIGAALSSLLADRALSLIAE